MPGGFEQFSWAEESVVEGWEFLKLMGGAEGTSNIGGENEGCPWAETGCGASGANVTQFVGDERAETGARTDSVEYIPAHDMMACDGVFALKTTKSTLSGRSLLNCFKAFARSQESEIATSNVLVKSIIYSASEGMRLNT